MTVNQAGSLSTGTVTLSRGNLGAVIFQVPLDWTNIKIPQRQY
ncbi:rCG40755, partial [Rattus norvegicus]